MVVDADTVASAFVSCSQQMVSTVPGGWTRRVGGALAAVTGIPLPTFNGVWAERSDPDEHVVADMIRELAATGLPYCVQMRPGAPESLGDLAVQTGMVPDEQLPLMVLEDPGALEAARTGAEGLVIRELSADDAVVHAKVAARGFEAPEEPLIQLMTPSVLRLEGTRCYIGELDGEAVTTGLGWTSAPSVAIFNIATLRAYRGKGFGAAITAQAAADGLADGASWSWLQSSAAGYSIYSKLGYRTIERWSRWAWVPGELST